MRAQIKEHTILYAITAAIPIANAVILLLCLNHYKPHRRSNSTASRPPRSAWRRGPSSQ